VARRDRRGRARLPVHDRVSRPRGAGWTRRRRRGLAVHGCGGVGLSAVQLGDALGARIVAVDVDDDALSLARDLGPTRL